MKEAPLVTVLVPARDEAADIEACLRSVLAQDHPHDRLEVIVVDGGSNDATPEIVEKTLAEAGLPWQVVHNPVGTTPSNLNAGLRRAAGEIVCRVDARSLIPPHYVRRCSETLLVRPDVSVVGGAQVAVARCGAGPVERGIAHALNNRFTMGAARYRSGRRSGSSDTVYLGAFRTADLSAVGGWDEYLHTNQDFDLNRRLGQRGTVWFDADLRVGYLPRQRLADLWVQYHRFGRWKVRYWRKTGDRPVPRQVVLLAAPAAALAAVVGWVRSGPVPHRGALAGAGASLALGLLDHVGSDPRARSPRLRVTSAVAMALAATGWLTGVAAEALRGGPAGGRLRTSRAGEVHAR